MTLRSIVSALMSLPLILSAPFDTQSPILDAPSYLFPHSPSSSSSSEDILTHKPTRYESTILGRRLLALSSTGVISSIFAGPTPDDGWTAPPSSVSSLAIALPDYVADCEGGGNPTLLFLDPSTSSRNTRGPATATHPTNISLAISWWDRYAALTGHKPYSPASLPRLAMIGYVQEIEMRNQQESAIVSCFLQKHPDAKWWLPGDPRAAHKGRWVRMVVQEVYWMGGFGDRHFIGWFEREEWKNVTREEWEGVRLPGEE